MRWHATMLGIITMAIFAACTQTPASPTETPAPTATPTLTSQEQAFLLEVRDAHWDNNALALWWEPPALEAVSWVVERAESPDGLWEVIRVLSPEEAEPDDANYARYWDSRLPPGKTYYYRLYACTDQGRTDYSNVASGTVPEPMPGTSAEIIFGWPVKPPC